MIPNHSLQAMIRSSPRKRVSYKQEEEKDEEEEWEDREYEMPEHFSRRSLDNESGTDVYPRKAWNAPNVTDAMISVKNTKSPKKRHTRARFGRNRRNKTGPSHFALKPATYEQKYWTDDREDVLSNTEKTIDKLRKRLHMLEVQRDDWKRKLRTFDSRRDVKEAEKMLRAYDSELQEISQFFDPPRRDRKPKTKAPAATSKRAQRSAEVVLAALKKKSGNDTRVLLRSLRELGECFEAASFKSKSTMGFVTPHEFSKVLHNVLNTLTATECEAISYNFARGEEDGNCDYIEFLDVVFAVRDLDCSEGGDVAVESTKRRKSEKKSKSTSLRATRKNGRHSEGGDSSVTHEKSNHSGRWNKAPTVPCPFPGVSRHVEAFEARARIRRQKKGEAKRADDSDNESKDDDETFDTFHAREVPASTFESRYASLVEKEEERRRERVRQRKLYHQGQSCAFEGIFKREAEMKRKRASRMRKYQRNAVETRKSDTDAIRVTRQRAAAEREKQTRSSYDDFVRRSDDIRRERIEKRRENLLRDSHLPPRMETEGERSRSPRRRVRNDGRKKPFKPVEIPDFESIQTRWETQLSDARKSFHPTEATPFSFDDPESPRQVDRRRRAQKRKEAAKKRKAKAAKSQRERNAPGKGHGGFRMMHRVAPPREPKSTRSSDLRYETTRKEAKQKQRLQKRDTRRQMHKAKRQEELAMSLRSQWWALDKSRKGRMTIRMAEEKARAYRTTHSKDALKQRVDEYRSKIEENLKDRVPLWMRSSLEGKKEKAKAEILASVEGGF